VTCVFVTFVLSVKIFRHIAFVRQTYCSVEGYLYTMYDFAQSFYRDVSNNNKKKKKKIYNAHIVKH